MVDGAWQQSRVLELDGNWAGSELQGTTATNMSVVGNGVGTYQIGIAEERRCQKTRYDRDHGIQLLLLPSPDVLVTR